MIFQYDFSNLYVPISFTDILRISNVVEKKLFKLPFEIYIPNNRRRKKLEIKWDEIFDG